ncbi:MAG: hypothetical protein GY938_13825 [Ketobacter sp.]|nr:hypothetical protein [Ketobacter sp.]
MNTQDLADEIVSSIQFAVDAHIRNPNSDSDSVRFWDMSTPYIVHPAWCAMTILTECNLPEEVRLSGYKALIWHDVLEDTKLTPPKETSSEVLHFINEMTFTSFSSEQEEVWGKAPVVRLFKLYDKVSNLLDGDWMKTEKWNSYVDFTRKLISDVELNYGPLNIVIIGKAVCEKR